ncbi:MAG: hypothetical protein R3C04_03200 [Hyphomonas sp.]
MVQRRGAELATRATAVDHRPCAGRHRGEPDGAAFTGDWAGDLLCATLDKFGFSEGRMRPIRATASRSPAR